MPVSRPLPLDVEGADGFGFGDDDLAGSGGVIGKRKRGLSIQYSVVSNQ